MKIQLFQRGQVWYYSFTLNGERTKGTTGLKGAHSREKALLVAEKAYRALERGFPVYQPELEPASKVLAKYKANHKAQYKRIEGEAKRLPFFYF